jgi:hypothetical protein
MTALELIAAATGLAGSGSVAVIGVRLWRLLGRAFAEGSDGKPSAWAIEVKRRDDPTELARIAELVAQSVYLTRERDDARSEAQAERKAGAQCRACRDSAVSDRDNVRALHEACQAENARLRALLSKKGIES